MNFQDAIIFATNKHVGQTRKCGTTPYIVHPMEVMVLLTACKCSKDVIIAGVLHDTLEDTATTAEELTQQFGRRVTELVLSHTENKTKSWTERKQHTIDGIATLTLEQKQLLCADQISNVRSITRDLKQQGSRIWANFTGSKDQILWYYQTVFQTLKKHMRPCKLLTAYSQAIDALLQTLKTNQN